MSENAILNKLKETYGYFQIGLGVTHKSQLLSCLKIFKEYVEENGYKIVIINNQGNSSWEFDPDALKTKDKKSN